MIQNEPSSRQPVHVSPFEKREHFAECDGCIFEKNDNWTSADFFPNWMSRNLEQSPSISSICIPTFLLDYVCRFVLILIVGPQASIPLTPCLSNNYPTWLNHPLCYLLHLSLREDTHCWEVWEGETEKQDSWWVGLQSHNNTWHYMAAHPMGGFCQASASQFVFPYVWRDKE